MTKEQYLQWREKPEVPIELWFDFYRERGGTLSTIEEFGQIFATLVRNEAVVTGSDGQLKQITADSSLRKFREYYDAKFGL